MTDRTDQALMSSSDRMESSVEELRQLSMRSLGRMYLPDKGVFAFRLRREDDKDALEGVSRRYTAIALLGLVSRASEAAETIFGGRDPRDVCSQLASSCNEDSDIGSVALTLWASRVWDCVESGEVLNRLRVLDPVHGSHPTVEVSWALASLAIPGRDVDGDGLANSIADRLFNSVAPGSGLFHHWPVGATTSRLRAHVCCFADMVYPIQAMSQYFKLTGEGQPLEFATRCAAQMCDLQGNDGQWWWHFDVRNGRVVEGYPVYAIHQDAMGPMALFALEDVGGPDHFASAAKGVHWLLSAPELSGGSLIDNEADAIWRKVARKEPGKLTRTVQAVASRAHPSLRVPGVNSLFAPGRIDYETRPYHMGWLLYAWSDERLRRLATLDTKVRS